MHRNRILVRLPAMLALALAACPGNEEPGSIVVTVGRSSLDGSAQTTDVRVTVLDDKYQAGTGTVHLKARAGDFAGKGGEIDLTLQQGKASTTYGCDRASIPECTGTVRIEATWKEVVATTTVVISPPDAGTGGTDGGP